ncbi:MAG: bifunctional phosphopantothenoylcysteine decarboxylase/phosphopantothenate--cysteine ligase CoaBC [Myxococcales bacterium]
MSSLSGKRIAVGVGGGIAAFKAVQLVRELMRRGAQVRVAMTPSAARFVGPVTFTGLTGTPPVLDLWDASYAGEVHVELAAWAEAIVVAPATANLLARAAAGMADDAVLATLRCADVPLLVAPAMHHRMWKSKATQRALGLLEDDGYAVVGPVHGKLASGEEGFGRMSEPEAIADAVEQLFAPRVQDLVGLRVLVSAGPTVEDLDPVRFLSNRSSGRMGYAIAERAVQRGADVVLVSGPVNLTPPAGCRVVQVRSALEMHAAVMAEREQVDAVVMTAAVADYRAAEIGGQKLKKTDELTLKLVKNPDILADLGAARAGKRPVLVGFALETQNVIGYAQEKLQKKKVDLVVANHANDGLGGDTNHATFVHAGGVEDQGLLDKRALADRIWNWVRDRQRGA